MLLCPSRNKMSVPEGGADEGLHGDLVGGGEDARGGRGGVRRARPPVARRAGMKFNRILLGL